MTTAVVAGSITGVRAAPASAPLAEVAVAETLAPVLHGKATAAGSGSQSIRFSARTPGAYGWDLLDGVSVAGTDAYRALPTGRLGIGDAFEYQIAHCDDTGCTSSEVRTGAVSPALGAGERPGATRSSFPVGDRIGAQVDVGSGNLLVTADLFALPRRSGSPLDVGLAYNSVTRRGEAHFLQIYGYAGGLDDPNSSLIHFGQRWYDPTTGRFTQPDATGQDPHYTYAANSPTTYTDMSGACSPPNCRSISEDARAAGAACAAGAAIRAGVGELLKKPFKIFKPTPGGLVVSCLTGFVGAVSRVRPFISTTPS